MTRFKDVLERNEIPLSLSTVTNRELALINVIEIVLSEVVHLLCT
jgi:hypothetical protein